MSLPQNPKRITNSKPIPHIPLPFKEVMADVLKGETTSQGQANAEEKE
jgi:hypothetical protein